MKIVRVGDPGSYAQPHIPPLKLRGFPCALYNDDDLFLVDSFPLGEIEERVDRSVVAPTATEAEWEEAKRAAEAHFNGDLARLSSDRVWHALIDRSALEGLIAETAADPDPCP